MIPKPVKEILSSFDGILNSIKSLNNSANILNQVSKELDQLKLWRDEIESGKHSIYIVGKTSTGKSEFHNFILDIDDKNDALFKTSTKVETGIIQTLEHCSKRESAYAKIILKDQDEFDKLKIPKDLKIKLVDDSVIFPLSSTESIKFFREKIIAKSDTNKTFDLIKAVETINIKFPLKYLKDYRLVDTPGLASSISSTDIGVRNNFHGKSFVFWFLDGSKRSLSDSLVLLKNEKDLIKNNVDRVTFIFNKFDLMEYDDDFKNKEEVEKRKDELISNLNSGLSNFCIEDKESSIHFTSFKNPNKKFPYDNTHQVLINIENRNHKIGKEYQHKNISTLTSILSGILKKVDTSGIKYNLKIITEKLSTLERRKKEILLLSDQNVSYSSDTANIIKKSIIDINNNRKSAKLNTHKKFSEGVNKFNRQFDRACEKVNNSTNRMEELKLSKFRRKLAKVERIEKFDFKSKESIWNKYVKDNELKKQKQRLNTYINSKLNSINDLMNLLEDEVFEECESLLVETGDKIHQIKERREYLKIQSKIIKDCEGKIKELDTSLLRDVEDRVYHWNPKDYKDNFESFLDLYTLIQEHNFLVKK